MGNSILTDIKKLLGITEDYTQFDTDIRIHINAAISTLTQLGVGPNDSFVVTSAEDTWDDYVPDGKALSLIKDYIYLKVKKLFDPPQSSVHVQAINEELSELEFRINAVVDIGLESSDDTK